MSTLGRKQTLLAAHGKGYSCAGTVAVVFGLFTDFEAGAEYLERRPVVPKDRP